MMAAWRLGKAQLCTHVPLKFLIQAASAKFPYRIKMVCGHIEIRMLNLKTIGRYFDDDLVINAGSGACAECDPGKADRREYQAMLNEQHGIGINPPKFLN
jgi:hypothetical protein